MSFSEAVLIETFVALSALPRGTSVYMEFAVVHRVVRVCYGLRLVV